MKKYLLCLGTVSFLAGAAQAQDIYLGMGLPNKYTIGYANPFSQYLGLRGEYAGGTSLNSSGTDNGVSYEATFKSRRAGLFGDWFAFGGGFRFVGGVTSNDIQLEVNSVGSGTATINGKSVSMTGNYFNVNMKYAPVTPYLGIGYGHHKAASGLGFYFDVGATYGTFTADVTTNLVGVGTITQADVDAQKQKMNDSLGSYKWIPSFSAGLLYRF